MSTEELQKEIDSRSGVVAMYKGRRLSGYALDFAVHEDDYLSSLAKEERADYLSRWNAAPTVEGCDATDSQL